MGVITAPLAIIKVDNKVVGKMKNVRVNETYQRGRVVGLGQLTASEVPVTGFTGTINCSFYVIDFENHPMFEKALLRKTNNASNFVNTILLDEAGFTIELIKKVVDTTNAVTADGRTADGIFESVNAPFASIRKVFITSDSFDISEGQIGGRDGAFEYLEPINYTI